MMMEKHCYKEEWYNNNNFSNNKLLRDFPFHHKIEHNRPDIIKIASPFDHQVSHKEQEKIEKYQDLKRKQKRLCNNCKEVVLLPIIIGALGTVSNKIHLYLKKAGLDRSMQPITKSLFTGNSKYYKKSDG